MRLTPTTTALLLAVSLAACGSDKKNSSDTGPTTNNPAGSPNDTPSGESTVETTDEKMRREASDDNGSGARASRQSTDSIYEQADLSESATTGTDDNGGYEASPKAPSDTFAFVLQGATGFTGTPDAPNTAYASSLHFRGNKYGGVTLDGNLSAQVTPTPLPMVGLPADTNMSMVVTFDFNRVLENGDVAVVKSEPNMVVTKAGRRATGTVTRTMTGVVHRTLSSATDANLSFDLTVTHAGTTVVDTYAAGKLQARTINGTTSIANKLTGETAQVTYDNVTRRQQGCICPDGGTVKVLVTAKDGTLGDYTYAFNGGNGPCGSCVFSLETTATAAATAAINAQVTNPNNLFSGKASVQGDWMMGNCGVRP